MGKRGEEEPGRPLLQVPRGKSLREDKGKKKGRLSLPGEMILRGKRGRKVMKRERVAFLFVEDELRGRL